jgi:calcium-dependent protein kinase
MDKSSNFLIRKETFIKKNDSKIDQVYRISKKPLGTGAYGVVSKCTHLTTK